MYIKSGLLSRDSLFVKTEKCEFHAATVFFDGSTAPKLIQTFAMIFGLWNFNHRF